MNDICRSNLDDYLCHYGILGMKWGRRKDRSKRHTINKKNVINSAIVGSLVGGSRVATLARLGRASKRSTGYNPYHSHEARLNAVKHIGALAVTAGLATYGTLAVSDAIERRNKRKGREKHE